MRIEEKDGGVLLHVKVVPNSSRTAVVGWLGEALKVKVAAPPEGGKANKAVVELLEEVLGAKVTIVSGTTQARKVVRIEGMTGAEVMGKLESLKE